MVQPWGSADAEVMRDGVKGGAGERYWHVLVSSGAQAPWTQVAKTSQTRVVSSGSQGRTVGEDRRARVVDDANAVDRRRQRADASETVRESRWVGEAAVVAGGPPRDRAAAAIGFASQAGGAVAVVERANLVAGGAQQASRLA